MGVERGNTPTSIMGLFYFGRLRMFKRLRGWHWAVLLVASAIIVVTVQSAFAGLTKAPSNGFGRSIVHVVTVSDTTPTAPATAAFTAVTGATATVNADSGDLLDIRFSAESTCSGAAAGGACNVRILVDGIAANPDPCQVQPGNTCPAATLNDVFDSATGIGAKLPGARGIERWVTVPAITGATHTIKVEYQAATGTTFTLRDWNLTVEHASAA
jgi:hypothetical protein